MTTNKDANAKCLWSWRVDYGDSGEPRRRWSKHGREVKQILTSMKSATERLFQHLNQCLWGCYWRPTFSTSPKQWLCCRPTLLAIIGIGPVIHGAWIFEYRQASDRRVEGVACSGTYTSRHLQVCSKPLFCRWLFAQQTSPFLYLVWGSERIFPCRAGAPPR